MKLRMVLTATVLVCLAATAVADLSKDVIEWRNGPIPILFTNEETQKWNEIRGDDAAARAFIALFWARRDPTPDTPRNEYREQIEQLVKFADDNFKGEKIRGAMTDRGETLLVYGLPKRAERTNAPREPGLDPNADLQRNQNVPEAALSWTYEGADTKEIFGTPRATIRFVDRNATQEFHLERNGRVDLTKARKIALDRTIKQANLTVAPTFQVQTPAAPAAAPAAPAVVTELTTDAFKTAVADLQTGKNPYDKKAFASWGEYVTSYGETFVPVGLYVPKSSGISGDVTFFGVIEDASGKNVVAFEEPAKLTASKDDFFVHKSLTVPGGKGRAILGLAQGGKVVALTSNDIELTGSIDKDATAVSPLLLSNNIYPLTESQKPTDPFAFGGVKVVPKADHTFRPSDDLWYFFELRNPGVAEPALPEGTVPVNPAEVQALPKLQVKMDVTGKDATGKDVKMSAPLREADAIAMKGVPGHYGFGNAIPLATFKPGDYTFTIKVIDTIKKASYTMSDTFKVVQ